MFSYTESQTGRFIWINQRDLKMELESLVCTCKVQRTLVWMRRSTYLAICQRISRYPKIKHQVCVKFCSGIISQCRKRKPVSLLTIEAEYRATVEVVQESTLLKLLTEDLHLKIDYPIPLHSDNRFAVRLVENSRFNDRTKHVEVHHHFI